jgi:predicted TIM-barrel fold metal-dependent hydrolase
MDLNGVWGSLNFPSFLPGFAGQRLQMTTNDRDLALATTRAWNDWHLDAWCGAAPERLIPCQVPWMLDPELGAQMIRENAERGFRAVTFPEAPNGHGLPTIHSGYWDPFIEACAETGTVINLHIGSAGASPSTSDDAPPDVTGVLFFGYAMFAAVDWLYSMYPVRFPDLKICLSEGGIGWVAGLLDRLDHMLSYHEMYGTWTGDLTPAEVMKRNFWFCAVEDPSSFDQRDRIGTGNILLEADYPHCDSTWPRTQAVIDKEIGHLPADDIAAITWRNASDLYRFPVPQSVVDDPNSF